MSKDYYNTLGINKEASQEEIKKAFRKKAHEHHPDKGNGNADKFKEVNEAYQVLGKPEKRRQYDQFGTTFEGMGGQAAYDAGFDWADMFRQGGPSSGYRTSGFNINFDDLGDIFGDFFGGSRTSGRSSRGVDMEASLTIGFEEAVFGIEKVLDISKQIVCDKCRGNGAEPNTKIINCKTCGGSGQVTTTQQTFFGAFRSNSVCQNCGGEGKVSEKKCTQCHGSGVTQGQERIKVKIPAGISNNETIKLSGKGEAGVSGLPAGDLYIHITVPPHHQFSREGDNIFTAKNISFSQAALGAKVRVKTLDGEVNLKIPSGTQSGRQFILKNKGSHKLRGRGRGDMIVEVKIQVPGNLSQKQKKLLEELADEGL
ncbi:molecular chaperone DnaJ [Patescibacteria group bacterium]|nr:molecular chaperone DnaJ [Patescibacteria group bacterium]